MRPFSCTDCRSNRLPIGHFLSHVEQQLAIFVVGLAEQAAKLVQVTSLLAGAAPGDVVGGLTLGQIRQLRWLFTVVEELIKRAFEGAGQLLQSLNGGNSVTIFDSGNVTTK